MFFKIGIIFIFVGTLATITHGYLAFERRYEVELPESESQDDFYNYHMEESHQMEKKPKYATSYQSFHIESKNPVPVLVKKEYTHHMDHDGPIHGFEKMIKHEVESHSHYEH